MIRIIPYTYAHMQELDEAGQLPRELCLNKVGRTWMELARGFAAIEEGRVICVGGILPMSNGVAELWMIPTAAFKRHALVLQRTTKLFIEMFYNMGFKRLQLHVDREDSKLNRWAKTLGFTHTGEIPLCGIDHRIYNRYILL